jgi:hypothetical protein
MECVRFWGRGSCVLRSTVEDVKDRFKKKSITTMSKHE